MVLLKLDFVRVVYLVDFSKNRMPCNDILGAFTFINGANENFKSDNLLDVKGYFGNVMTIFYFLFFRNDASLSEKPFHRCHFINLFLCIADVSQLMWAQAIRPLFYYKVKLL